MDVTHRLDQIHILTKYHINISKGDTLIFSYIRKTPTICFGLKILNFGIFVSFLKKNEYFLGYKNCVDIFGVITKLE